MFKVTQSWQMPVNLLVAAVFIFCIARGWQKGLLRSLLSLFSMFLALFLAWNTKDIPASRISVLPRRQINLPGMDAAYAFLNQIIWFFILFVIFRILFFIVDRVLKRLHSVKGIRQISGILGCVFGGIQAVLWCLLLCMILRTPLFRNGSLAVNGTALGFVEDITGNTMDSVIPEIRDKAFSITQTDVRKLTSGERKNIEKWPDENDYDQKGDKEK